MRRVTGLLAVLCLLMSCSPEEPAKSAEPRGITTPGGETMIRGSFHVGGRSLADGWVEMVELTGPPKDRCGRGDCGLSIDALRVGVEWNPGRWRVIAPTVKGWIAPSPFEIVVRLGAVTKIEASYANAAAG